MTKNYLLLGLFGAAFLVLTACSTTPSGRAPNAPPVKPVAAVDLNRYAGLWYEIARYPTSFEKDCQGVTAEYAKRPDGRIDVTNTCRTGRPRAAKAVAKVMPGSNGARLFVNFAPIPLPERDGNYFVLHLDENYQHALVGDPSGRFLWMLARTPTITPEVRKELEDAATNQFYRLDWLEEVSHP